MDADAHIQVLQGWVLRLLALFGNDVNHFEADLDHSEGFVDLDNLGASFFGDLARVAHNDVAVADSVHFVDSDLFTELVELAEQPRQETHDFLRFSVLREFGEANHVSIEESDVIERVNDTLVILDTGKHVQRHKFA